MDQKRIDRYNKAQADNFDDCYDRFLLELPRDVVQRMEQIVSAPAINKGETVLDVGTGTGALIPLIQSYRPRIVVACDLSGMMLAQVAQRFPDVERHQCDIRALPLAEQSIDVVFMNAMFGNIADKIGALANVQRMLRPGGRVVISHPEGRAFVAGIVRSEPFPITPLPSESEARALFSEVGLSLERYVDEPKLLIALGQLPVGGQKAD